MKVLVNESSLEDIANAIRSKNGDTAKYKPSEMGAAIANINVSTETIPPIYHIEFKDITAEELDLSWLRTDNIEDFSAMFTRVPNLKSVNLSKFNTSKAVTMADMFYGCNNLENIDLSTFDTSLVTDMSEMFLSGYETVYKKHIDFRNADFSNVATVGSGIFIDRKPIICNSDSCEKVIDVIVKDDEQKAKLATLLNQNEQDMVAIRTVAEL